METTLKILIVALSLAVGGYLFSKPERVYTMALTKRGRGEGGADSGPTLRVADISSIRWAGGFIILTVGYVVYLWLRA